MPKSPIELKSKSESNGHEPEISTEERIIEKIEKYRPIFKRIWEARKKLLIINFAVIVLTLVYLLIIVKPYFDSSITILPDYGSKLTSLGQLSELAAMAGVNLGGDAIPTEIYQNLIQSETIFEKVIFSKYMTKEFKDSVNLIQYFKMDLDDELPYKLRIRKAFLKLYKELTKNYVSFNIDRTTRALTVTVRMPESKLSASVVNKISESLDQYVRTQRKSYASEQRFYLEKRIFQIKDSLTIAENTLKSFREQNRVIIQSPQLILREARLIRSIEIMQTVFIELTKQLEIAKIDEIKDTPVLNIKEIAQDPIIKTGPSRLINLLTIILVSLILSTFYYGSGIRIKSYLEILKNHR